MIKNYWFLKYKALVEAIKKNTTNENVPIKSIEDFLEAEIVSFEGKKVSLYNGAVGEVKIYGPKIVWLIMEGQSDELNLTKAVIPDELSQVPTLLLKRLPRETFDAKFEAGEFYFV